MRLRGIEDEQPRGVGLLLDAAALDHRPAGLGHRYDQGLVDVGRVVLPGEVGAHHAEAGSGPVPPVPRHVVRITASQIPAPPSPVIRPWPRLAKTPGLVPRQAPPAPPPTREG